jgi:DNA-binding NarL/FixJ family response regulator
MQKMAESIRLLIADDHPMFLEGVVHSLENEQDIEIIGQVSSGEEAFEIIIEKLPDVVMLDITMPGEGGISTTKRIATNYPVIKIIILTGSEDDDDLIGALKAGASGYIVKGIAAKELVNAVRAVAGGGTYISPEMAGSLLRDFQKPQTSDPMSELSEREHQILELVSQGMTNRDIGNQLHLSEKTIKHYMTNIFGKLHVTSRVQAALIAKRKAESE